MKFMENLPKGGELCQKSQLETSSAILDENLIFTRYNELIKKIERKGEKENESNHRLKLK